MSENAGYVECDTTWSVLCDDETFLSVRMEGTVNAGGSVNYSRCFTMDKSSGKVLELKDLFPEDSDYINLISEEILRQMEEKVRNEGAMYFIPGGIWSEEECFRQIAPDQNFYINEQDQLVIMFDEYEVAPGSMGSPEFVIEL